VKNYIVHAYKTGFFTGTMNEKTLEQVLNHYAQQGFRFVRSIHEEKKSFLFFKREAHLLIFEREV
jgi:hypothetical protein